MDIELLAKQMRDRAILIELQTGSDRAIQKARRLPKPKYKSVEQRIEDLKKTYFHAGRWSAGARDHTARRAFEKIQQ